MRKSLRSCHAQLLAALALAPSLGKKDKIILEEDVRSITNAAAALSAAMDI